MNTTQKKILKHIFTMLLCCTVFSSSAATRLVTTLDDSGAGSLRDALLVSFSGDVISFAPGLTGAISLASGLFINADLTITQTNLEAVAISGNYTNSIFSIASGRTVTISGLVMVLGGGSGLGTAIANSGTVTLNDCTIGNCGGNFCIFSTSSLNLNRCRIAGNSTIIYASGQTKMNNCSISDNAVSVNGFIANYGTLSITNSTITRNSCSPNGGGIYNGGTLFLSSCTVCSNSTSASGGGIYSYGTVQLQNTIIARNRTSTNGPDLYVSTPSGTVTSQGYNLIGATNGTAGWVTSDQTGSTNAPINPLLGPFQNNGGRRFTHALLAGSPAIDAGNSFGLTTDQRGESRPYDNAGINNAPGGDGSDIGAYEVGAVSPPGTNIAITRVVTTLSNGGAGSLREALGVSVSGDAITFDGALSGVISLASSLPGINGDLSIIATNIEAVTIDGNDTNSIFGVFNGNTLTISGLVIVRGGGTSFGSAIGNSAGNLTVNDCTIGNSGGNFCIFSTGTAHFNRCRIAGNTSIIYLSGQTTLNNSSVSDNSVSGDGFIVNYGTMSITNSTISRNSSRNGGGVYNPGNLLLSSCTVCSNLASGGGGGVYSYGTLQVQNSIIAGNRGTTNGPDLYVSTPSGAVASHGYNLVGATNGSTGWLPSDQTGSSNTPINALLGPFQNNGGRRFTHALLPGSPAIDGGKSFGLTTDQRGESRPYDNAGISNAPGGDGSDIGSYEAGPVTVPGTNIAIIRVVTTVNNAGAGSLREAMEVSVSGDAITFAGGLAGTISLTSPLPFSRGDLTVLETNVESVTINGNNTNSMFGFGPGLVTISGLALVRAGPALSNSGGTATINDCSIGNCSGTHTIFNNGVIAFNRCRIAANSAIIYSQGQMVMNNSTISENIGGSSGFIANYGTLSMTNTTISRNSSSGGSGGGINNSSTLWLSSCTICSNSCSGSGGGIYTFSDNVLIQNTLIAGNSAPSGPDFSGTASSQGYNLIGTTNGSTGWVASDLTGSTISPLNPLIGPLQDNGGPRFTHALKPGSPAIDAGKSFGLSTDQRGRTRPFDLRTTSNAPGGDSSDIGAFELNPPVLSIAVFGSAAFLSWPASDTGYSLESTPAFLNPPSTNTWTAVPGTPTIVGGQFTVTNSPVVGNKFYRLKSL